MIEARRQITMGELIGASRQLILHERDIVLHQLLRNGIDVIEGHACFDSPRQVTVTTGGPGDQAHRTERVTADHFVIAIGTQPAMPEHVPFTDRRVFTSDGLLNLEKLPKSMIVVGGGVIGTEYACMMATLGVKVTLVEGRRQV